MNILEFDSLELVFGLRKILSSVYMKCETGRIVGLLGRNGSGKSCLMKIVFGTMPCGHKSIRVNRSPLLGNYLKEKVISYLPQEDFIPGFLKLRQAASLFAVEMGKINHACPELADLGERRPAEVSGGQLRLFEILLILFSTHPFCILDEPFSGLTPIHVERLIEVLREEKNKKGIIITDHLHRHVRSLADDVYLLTNGKTHAIKNEDQLVRLGYLGSIL